MARAVNETISAKLPDGHKTRSVFDELHQSSGECAAAFAASRNP